MMEQSTPSFCTQCRSRCGCNTQVVGGKLVGITPLKDHPSGAKLCPKGQAVEQLVYHPERLLKPHRRVSPKGVAPTQWAPISWAEALQEITQKMAHIRDLHGPEQVAFSVTTPSGTQISDAISWIERFIRVYGSPNTIYGTEICNWHKDVASRFTYGTDIGTPDFANTDCVILWGNNPAATWLARVVEIQKARDRGAKMLVIDPRPTLHARLADCWLKIKPGSDQALALGLAQILVKQQDFDQAFVTQWSNGPLLVREDTGELLRYQHLDPSADANLLVACDSNSGELLKYDTKLGCWQDKGASADLYATTELEIAGNKVGCRSAFCCYQDLLNSHDLADIAELTGVSVAQMREAANLIAASKSCAYYAWNGVGQSINASQTDRAISILYGITGHYGKQGGNVPGGAAAFADVAGHDLLSDKQRQLALGIKEHPLGPPTQGWVTARSVYKAILEQAPYPVRMLFSFGGNLLAAQPDTDLAKQALEQLNYHVHADYFINATAEYADIVLPVASAWEREGLRTGFDASLKGMQRIQMREAAILPIGQSRSDVDIVFALAKSLALGDPLFDGSKEDAYNHILAPASLTVAQLLEHPEGIELDQQVPLAAHTLPTPEGNPRGFPTPSKRLEIYSERLLQHGYDPLPNLADSAINTTAAFPLQLTSAKVLAFCHSQHRNFDNLRKMMPNPIIEISPKVATARNILRGDWVKITTPVASYVAQAKIIDTMQEDTVVGQHGWWLAPDISVKEFANDPMASNINRTIATDKADPISGSIPLRNFPCQIVKLL